MGDNLVESMKKAALEAEEAAKPVQVMFGTVISIAPLQIKVEQKITLEAAQLILTRNVTDYTVDLTMNHNTETHTHTHDIYDTWTGGGSASMETHLHEYKGRKNFTVHNSLIVGDEVLLLRVRGGQKFVVWDRTG